MSEAAPPIPRRAKVAVILHVERFPTLPSLLSAEPTMHSIVGGADRAVRFQAGAWERAAVLQLRDDWKQSRQLSIE
jgi:hypothetical protein